VVCSARQSTARHHSAPPYHGERSITAVIANPIIYDSAPGETSIRLLGLENKDILLRLRQDRRSRRGRDASYPTPPAQIPACGFPAPGSSVRLAAAIQVPLDIAIALREVGLGAPALHVRPKFPVKAASHRHPLPHVDGSPALRVL
jgi:hypothetical protein